MDISCIECNQISSSEDFYETHQHMTDGRLWCINYKTRSVDEMTTAIVNRYKAEVKAKYGNRKRHRQ